MTETCIMDGMTSAKFFDTMGKRIRILREDQGLNQTELAQRMAQCGGGVDPSYLSQMESDAKLPRLPVFVAIVRALGTTADYLRCTARQHPFWQVRADAVMPYILAEMARLAAVDIDALLAGDTAADDTGAAIAVARREVDRLQKSLQGADDAHFVAGTLDADRYARTVQRLQAEIANRQAEITRLEARRQTEAARGSRRQRLLDVIANGSAHLRAADPTAANVWLRAHLRVWLKNKIVVAVEWL